MNKGTNMNDFLGKKDAEKSKETQPAEEIVEKQEPTTEEEDKKETQPTNDTDPADVKEDEKKEDDPYKDWSKEDLIKEMKARGNEAAKYRVERKEEIKTVEQRYQEQLAELEKKFSPLAKKAAELDKLKEREADKKRNDEQKIAHRDQRINELLSEQEEIKASFNEEKMELQSKLDKLHAEKQAYENYWKEQLDKELAEIPEKFKSLADLMVKGTDGDTQKALEEIRKAKKENVFGAKKVQVFHSTPSAKEGARLDAGKAQKTSPKELGKNEKVKAGLKDWKKSLRTRQGME
jgi:hypothetical protein